MVLFVVDALPVRNLGPFAHQFDGRQIDQQTHRGARALVVVCRHLILHAHAVDVLGQPRCTPANLHPLAAGGHHQFIGGIEARVQGA
ncbi:hypothetical protein D3C72_1588040 [compost metagenome]